MLLGSYHILGSIVVSISACHVEDPGSIPGRGGITFLSPQIGGKLIFSTNQETFIKNNFTSVNFFTIIHLLSMNVVQLRNIYVSQHHQKSYASPAGNRTRVFHVTGGDTHHYTTEDVEAGQQKTNRPEYTTFSCNFHPKSTII